MSLFFLISVVQFQQRQIRLSLLNVDFKDKEGLFVLLMQNMFHEPSLPWCSPFLHPRPQTQWMLLSENMSCGLFVPLGVFWLRYTTAHHSKMTWTAGAEREINLFFMFIKI